MLTRDFEPSAEKAPCVPNACRSTWRAIGDALEDVSKTVLELAKSLPPSELAEKAYSLYERYRPEIPSVKKGWEAARKLDLDLIHKTASA